MGVEEFERRVDLAHTAESASELNELLRDLPGGDLPAVAGPGNRPARLSNKRTAAHTRDKELVVAVMGGSGRKGGWNPARHNYAVAIMGGVELDFREAVMGPGVTDLQVFTWWGGVEIIVPPSMRVESHGIALLGGFEHAADTVQPTDPEAPTLRITGVAIMGGVDITVRQLGETARDARRRVRIERRERRRLERGQ
jgi:hypothetical protein